MNNRQIIESYYSLHRDELLTFVSTRLGGSCEAEDIVQDVFLKLLCGQNPIIASTLSALAYTIVRNMIGDYYRRHHHQARNISLQDQTSAAQLSATVRALPPSSLHADSALLAHEVANFVERGLQRVPEECRSLYRMHLYGGLQVGELSQQLNQDYKSVEYRIGLARKAVRQQLRFVV